MSKSIFYCPKHGRVTRDDVIDGEVFVSTFPAYTLETCAKCFRWYHGLRKPKAKRTGES